MSPEAWLRQNTLPLMESVFREGDVAFCVADAVTDDQPLLYVNAAFERLTGYAASEVLGRNCRFLQGPDTDPDAVAAMRSAIAEQRSCVVVVRNVRKDGTPFANRVTISPVRDPDGRTVQFIGALADVTEQVEITDRLRVAEERYRRLVEGLPLVTYELDVTGAEPRLRFVSPQVEQITGFASDRWTGSTGFWASRLHPDDRERVLRAQRSRLADGSPYEIEYRMRCADGEVIWVWEQDAVVRGPDGEVTGRDGVMVDVTALKQAEAALEHQATHDALTGLPNRVLLLDRLQHALRSAGRHGTSVGVIFGDLDGFKLINDSLGHHVGDRILSETLPRLQRELRAGDTLSRFGGDEFVVVCEGVTEPDAVCRVAQRLLDAISRPVSIDGADHVLTASLGIAVGASAHDAAAVVRDADAAMYEAKRRGRNRFELFDRALHERTVTRLTLENDLRSAVRDGRLALVYQPIVTLADGSVHAVEALLRWSRETGPVSPAEFIPVAEQTGLIVEMGTWVLREACAQLAAWRARPGPSSQLRMRVNVSARQLTTAGFLDVLDGALRAADVPPSALGLEITEGVLLDTSDQVLATLEAVRDRGVEILLDDFGTGYSSLGYLQRFAIDAIKIDRSFVAQLDGGDGRSRAIVDAVVRMGQALEIGTVAEGIETEEQLAVLTGLGCDRGQGYLFSRPCPAEDLDLP